MAIQLKRFYALNGYSTQALIDIVSQTTNNYIPAMLILLFAYSEFIQKFFILALVFVHYQTNIHTNTHKNTRLAPYMNEKDTQSNTRYPTIDYSKKNVCIYIYIVCCS